ncbi:dTDP-4-dehydrorhamnose 3,5-epimerase family protein [Geomesophilobacter sediminis]|uniref:dTDP-4-dehydrorhamnose 3,5-epimerase n=1 Tax=Geomesophilobacter sediminis TaxID=2798584 RepID=A0A8J7M460_9BACT|nr:dTDP-4-dehydrorhamnose 3,5-epimerase family protein [Geomesophilobacter sediminis]MBJ6727756.1 dTDP-4-dehydrorhamnose 3,5-epimerase family protein [Geomesophilobacter sediminis]
MELRQTSIPGCCELLPDRFRDDRGSFVKTFHHGLFTELGLNTDWREEYYSVSHPRVLRGLHFQLPPHDHEKLVYCSAGGVLDVVLDLRRDSPSYGRHELFELNAERANLLYLPKGVAHGFYVTDGPATMLYKVATVYAPAHDTGIRWDSAGIPWPDADPVISQRDRSFAPLAEFVSPFTMGGAR